MRLQDHEWEQIKHYCERNILSADVYRLGLWRWKVMSAVSTTLVARGKRGFVFKKDCIHDLMKWVKDQES